MFLSIVIPVYNTELYIAECLDSCLDQDIAAEEYEIICVNDGSTDGSLQILEAYAQRYSHIRVISRQNAGVSVARNAGIQAAQGDYLWFVDSDDVVASNVLGALKTWCMKTDCDRLLFNFAICPPSIPTGDERAELIKNITEGTRHNPIYVFTSLARRHFVQEHNISFLPGLAYGEDEIFNYAWSLYPHQMEKFDGVVYFYRTRPGSAMQAHSAASLKKRLDATFTVARWLRATGHLNDFDAWRDDEHIQFNSKFALKYVRRVEAGMILIARLPWKDARSEWKKLKKSDLLDDRYMFTVDPKLKKIVRKRSVRWALYRTYFKKRISFICKHPKRFLA